MKSLWRAIFYSLAIVAAQPATPLDQFVDLESPQKIAEARTKIEALAFEDLTEKDFAAEKDLSQYSHLDPHRLVPPHLLESSLLYYDKNQTRFTNQSYIAVVDFGVRSDVARFYLVNLKSGEVERHYTTHGKGSDRNNDGLAESFGNEVNSGKSSLGPIRTAAIYYGKFNRSLRLDGLSKSNNQMRQRAVTLHGWDEVKEAPVIQGLSYGCLTFDWTIKDDIVDKLKDGALIYVGQSQ